MASVALTSLTATMKLEFLQPNNPRVSLDDEASISLKSLFEKLSSLQAFVQEKSATRELEMKIRDFALEAEDRIEIQLSNFLLAKNGEDQQKSSQKLHHILQEAAENAAELLKLSSSSISKEAVKNESEGPIMINSRIKHSPMMMVEEGRMVGRRRDHIQIVDDLIANNQYPYCGYDLNVITIIGMTGIGKTTLATSVYNDPKVASHFDVRGWVTMSREYNKREMLHGLLWTLTKEANIPDDDNDDDDDDVAARQVYNFLRGGGPATRELEVKIRDFALEAEDGIEIQLSNFLLANNGEDQQKASKKLHHILQEAAENAAELLKLSSSISKEAVIPLIKHSPMMMVEEGKMVGRRRDHIRIVDELIADVDSTFAFKVITIHGMTGIGKTTLATSVYNDPKVASHFLVRVSIIESLCILQQSYYFG